MNTVLLKEQDAAEYIGVDYPVLRRSRLGGRHGRTIEVPQYVPWGKCHVRYDVKELDKWKAKHG